MAAACPNRPVRPARTIQKRPEARASRASGRMHIVAEDPGFEPGMPDPESGWPATTTITKRTRYDKPRICLGGELGVPERATPVSCGRRASVGRPAPTVTGRHPGNHRSLGGSERTMIHPCDHAHTKRRQALKRLPSEWRLHGSGGTAAGSSVAVASTPSRDWYVRLPTAS